MRVCIIQKVESRAGAGRNSVLPGNQVLASRLTICSSCLLFSLSMSTDILLFLSRENLDHSELWLTHYQIRWQISWNTSLDSNPYFRDFFFYFLLWHLDFINYIIHFIICWLLLGLAFPFVIFFFLIVFLSFLLFLQFVDCMLSYSLIL